VVPLKCENCNKTFPREKRNVINKLKNASITHTYCSRACANKDQTTAKVVECAWCNKTFSKTLNQINRGKNNFCSRSCAASYNNTHKQHGTRRSKLEKWLEGQLTYKYPGLYFDFNNKEEINSELDIYIKALNLAFELNGIFHYEPIYGQEKLASIQNNDQRKFQACIEHGIELCILDVSNIKYFKPARGQKFLNIICDIINQKLNNNL